MKATRSARKAPLKTGDPGDWVARSKELGRLAPLKDAVKQIKNQPDLGLSYYRTKILRDIRNTPDKMIDWNSRARMEKIIKKENARNAKIGPLR